MKVKERNPRFDVEDFGQALVYVWSTELPRGRNDMTLKETLTIEICIINGQKFGRT